MKNFPPKPTDPRIPELSIVSFRPSDGIWTFYSKETPDVVWKGPYSPDSLLLKTLLDRSFILRKWKTNHINHPLKVFYYDREVWITFHNALGRYPRDSVLHDGYLLSTELISTLAFVTAENKKYYNLSLLVSYLHLYVLGVSDFTPFTTLIDSNGHIIIADYVGVDMKIVDRPLFYINDFIFATKELEDIFVPLYVEAIKYVECIDIDSLDINDQEKNIYKSNKRKSLTLLHKYSARITF